MANTRYLALQKINSSDYVSPDPINNNMDKLDALGVDYIVAQGKSGEWWYRKWHSGRAECGIDNKNFGKGVVSAWGNIYSTYNGFNFGKYPFAFKSAPFANISVSSTNNQGYYGIVMSASSSPTTLAPRVDLWRANDVDIPQVVLSIFVTGFYK